MQNKKLYRLVCVHCGREFWAKRPDALYCRAACKQADYRNRKEARKPPESIPLQPL
jgi:hypothetical protein